MAFNGFLSYFALAVILINMHINISIYMTFPPTKKMVSTLSISCINIKLLCGKRLYSDRICTSMNHYLLFTSDAFKARP